MDFKEKLLDSHLAFEQDVDLLHPIHDYRKKALKRFESDGFPTCLLYTSPSPRD